MEPPPDIMVLSYEMEIQLQRIAIDPANLEAHQTLYQLAQRYERAGGGDMGAFERMSALSKEGPDRLIAAERVWAHRVNDRRRIPPVLCALQAVQNLRQFGSLKPVRQWFYQHS